MRAETELLASGDSPVHRWDPRWKIASFAVFILALVSLRTVGGALAGLLLGYTFLATARLPPKIVALRLGAAHVLLLPCFLILPLTFGGESMVWGPFQISREGLRVAALLYLRAVAIITVSLTLVYSTPMLTLLRALQRLRMPRVLIQVALLAYRYAFTLCWEIARVRWAMTTRGFRGEASPRAYRALGNLVGLTFVRSLERTERIQRSMLCRGYQGDIHSLHRFAARGTDFAMSAVALVAASGLLATDRWLTTLSPSL